MAMIVPKAILMICVISFLISLYVIFLWGRKYYRIMQACRYFEKITENDSEKKNIKVDELTNSFLSKEDGEIIGECADIISSVYYLAKKKGFYGNPEDMLVDSYRKMKSQESKKIPS